MTHEQVKPSEIDYGNNLPSILETKLFPCLKMMTLLAGSVVDITSELLNFQVKWTGS